MIIESSTIFGGMLRILVVLTVETLVMFGGITSHLVWPLEVRFTLYLFKDLVNWLLEHRTDHLSIRVPRVTNKISPESTMSMPLCPRISSVNRNNLCLSLPLLLILLDPFMLINLFHELTHILCRFIVRDFLKSCSVGRPTLNVLITTSSKSPSISLNVSQYLSG